jgi:vanillate O-demethylase ferredoxin subunit
MNTATIPVRVARKCAEAEGICSFELVHADGAALPPFTAGAHVEVHLPGGITRPYSLCNSPADTQRYRIAVLRETASRGGSAALHEGVAEGDRLEIGAPRNLFKLADDAESHLLLAGGIGITPLLAMAEQLARQGAPFQLHYCARSRARAAFVEQLEQSAFADRVNLHFSDGDAAQRLDIATLLAQPARGQHLYACGPAGFMDAVLGAARTQGWPEAQLHHEVFGALPVDSKGDQAFEVQLGAAGRVVLVPAGCSIVAALAQAGVNIPTSCEQGICGTCMTTVLEGTPEHRDQYLTSEEQQAGELILPCCSRAKSARLVLAL